MGSGQEADLEPRRGADRPGRYPAGACPATDPHDESCGVRRGRPDRPSRQACARGRPVGRPAADHDHHHLRRRRSYPQGRVYGLEKGGRSDTSPSASSSDSARPCRAAGKASASLPAPSPRQVTGEGEKLMDLIQRKSLAAFVPGDDVQCARCLRDVHSPGYRCIGCRHRTGQGHEMSFPSAHAPPPRQVPGQRSPRST